MSRSVSVRPLLPETLLLDEPGLHEWAIAVAYRGSIAHGMYIPGSDPRGIDDKDIMAVCVPPLEYYFGLREYGSRSTREIHRGEWDIVIYEARKFIGLLARGNPNVLMMLWIEARFVLKTTPAFDMLRENRRLFAGRHVYEAFAGYARGQLHKMTHQAFQGYMGAKRKALVAEFGYDCKNAAHLVRLLRMGVEFLAQGELQVTRPDADELLRIKRGEWTLERVKAEAERWFEAAEEAYRASSLPDRPDLDAVNALAVKVIERAIRDRADGYPP